MEVFGLLLCGAVIGCLLIALVEGLRSDRTDPMGIEVEALRTCLRLSLAAWQAHQEMHQAASDARARRPLP